MKLLLSALANGGGLTLTTAKIGYKVLSRIPDEKELGGSAMDQNKSLPVVQADKPYLTPG
jgi:hypothetical protein